MAIKITGMNSNLDTDSIVQELVKAYSSKKEDLVKKQTTLGWKQEAWASLNTKIKNLYKNTVSNLQYESTYIKKKTSISNSNVATVVAGDSAVEGTQTLKVKKLAKAGNLTGGKLTKKVDGTAIDVEDTTTLSELGILADGESATIKVTVGGKEQNIEVKADTSIKSFVSSMNNAGINASYDSTNKRIFMNVTKSGTDADFKLEGAGNNGLKVLSGLRLVTEEDVSGLANYDNMSAAEQQALLDEEYNALLSSYKGKYDSAVKSLDALNTQLSDLQGKTADYETAMNPYTDSTSALYDAEVAAAMSNSLTDADRGRALADLANSTAWKDKLAEAEQAQKDGTLSSEQAEFLDKSKAVAQMSANYLEIGITQNSIADTETKRDQYDDYVNDVGGILTSAAQTELADKVQTAKDIKADFADTTSPDYETRGVRIKGQDAEIYLNGAQYTSSTNSFTVNGLTITAQELTEDDKEVSISTTEDVDGVYNTIKSFIKEYNALIKEMDTLYNADAAKGYEPLTDEEKDALSDSEVAKWEQKIKDSVLRRDSSLGSTISILKNSMMQSYSINGNTLSLASFGIETLSYYDSADNEKGVYHIDGDPEDSNTSGTKDKLKSMLATNKEDVVGFFTKMAGNMYAKLQEASKSVKDQRTYNNFYDDKLLKKDYEEYTTKIKEQEKKIAAMEDKYYQQFTAMEVALSKLNSQSSSLAGLLGG